MTKIINGVKTEVGPTVDSVSFFDNTDTHQIKAVQESGLGGRLSIGLDETARTLWIGDIGDIDTDHGLSALTDPALYIFNAAAASKVLLNTNGDSYFMGGLVGIGTTSPGYELDVNGNVNVPESGYYRFGSGNAQVRENGYGLIFDTWTGSALTEKMRVKGNGNVGIGTTSPQALLDQAKWSADAVGSYHSFTKSRNATSGSHAVVQDNDVIGGIQARPSDGTNFGTVAAQIHFEVDDASPAASSIGGAIVLSTAAGLASDDLTEAMRIDSSQRATFSGAIKNNTSTVTATGPTDDLDISGVNVVYINTNGNNVTIGGCTGGVAGQQIRFVIIDASNNTTIEHAEGANQSFYLESGGDETKTASYGGWIFECNGTHLYQVAGSLDTDT